MVSGKEEKMDWRGSDRGERGGGGKVGRLIAGKVEKAGVTEGSEGVVGR